MTRRRVLTVGDSETGDKNERVPATVVPEAASFYHARLHGRAMRGMA